MYHHHQKYYALTSILFFVLCSLHIGFSVSGFSLPKISFFFNTASADVPYLQSGYTTGGTGSYTGGTGSYTGGTGSYTGGTGSYTGGTGSYTGGTGSYTGGTGSYTGGTGSYTGGTGSYTDGTGKPGPIGPGYRLDDTCTNGTLRMDLANGDTIRMTKDGKTFYNSEDVSGREASRPAPGSNVSSYRSGYTSTYSQTNSYTSSYRSGYTSTYSQTNSYTSSYRSGYTSTYSQTNSYTSSYRSGYTGSYKGCFVATEKVLTPEGEKEIAQLKPGDIVVSFDEVTQSLSTSVIGHTIVHTATIDTHDYRSYPLLLLTTMVDESEQQTKVTANHHFFDPQASEYRPISEFSEGQMVRGLEGNVEIIKIEELFGGVTYEDSAYVDVYNLHMEKGPHNYFVNGVLVHNAK